MYIHEFGFRKELCERLHVCTSDNRLEIPLVESGKSPPHVGAQFEASYICILALQNFSDNFATCKTSTQSDSSLYFSKFSTANERLVRIRYKCLVPIYVFPEMKLHGLIISKTES
jgi:hypothetical protein